MKPKPAARCSHCNLKGLLLIIFRPSHWKHHQIPPRYLYVYYYRHSFKFYCGQFLRIINTAVFRLVLMDFPVRAQGAVHLGGIGPKPCTLLCRSGI